MICKSLTLKEWDRVIDYVSRRTIGEMLKVCHLRGMGVVLYNVAKGRDPNTIGRKSSVTTEIVDEALRRCRAG